MTGRLSQNIPISWMQPKARNPTTSVGALEEAYLLCRASANASSRQSCLQLQNVDASIFVEVQLLKQFGPALLPVLLKARRTAGLAVDLKQPSPAVAHNWCHNQLNQAEMNAF